MDNSLPYMMIQSKTNNPLSLIIWLGVLYNCRETFTDVMSALQIRLFMQNKAKFRKSQVNVNKVLTKDYDKRTLGQLGKQSQSKPIQSQLKPIKANQSQFKRQKDAAAFADWRFYLKL
jgi:hypothetical protein